MFLTFILNIKIIDMINQADRKKNYKVYEIKGQNISSIT
jgi:hypothetical protein